MRTRPELRNVYLILLTSRSEKQHILEGLEAGANDYVTKPFDRDELLARIRVGVQMLNLQSELADRVRELESSQARVHQLQGLLPLCSYCKSIRDNKKTGRIWKTLRGRKVTQPSATASARIAGRR